MATAERESTEKSFDCVAYMREARARLTEKMNSMSTDEFLHWMRHHEYSDPRLAKLAAEARPPRRPPKAPESEGA